jgi:uncharacterized membrane protein YphA (DoxX/SURF4 family)
MTAPARYGVLYARIAVGAAFLSAVASRFGLWDKTIDLKHFANFIQYTAEVNSFLPKAVIPFLAWTATIAETSLGMLLILGLWPQWVSLVSAALLGNVWSCDGDFLRSQVANGLFSLLCFRRGRLAGARCLQTEQQASF